MRHIFRTHAWIIAVAFVQLAASEPLNPSEWRYFSPILSSQVRSLRLGEVDSMLAEFCQMPLRFVERVDLTCTTRRMGSGFSDIVDRTFHPKGVILGHFLGPKSDDAAVSGSSAEGHAAHWGGTLLLSRRGAAWTPIWYRSAMVIDSCEKITLPDRREMLLCEDEDSGMGHALHYLYAVDFERPSDLEHSLLAKAETFKDNCLSQKQVLNGFHLRPDKQGFSVEVDTTDWRRLSTEPYCGNYPKGRPASLRLTFAATSEGLRKVEADPVPRQ